MRHPNQDLLRLGAGPESLEFLPQQPADPDGIISGLRESVCFIRFNYLQD